MPLTSYFVDFVAHIDERKRPENFPKQVHDKQVMDVESVSHLQMLVNDKFIKMVSTAGLVVLKDDTAIVDDSRIFSQRMFVPWSMVSFMTLDVRLMTTKINMQDSIVPGHIVPNPTKDIVN